MIAVVDWCEGKYAVIVVVDCMACEGKYTVTAVADWLVRGNIL